jgi:hypothetical protein
VTAFSEEEYEDLKAGVLDIGIDKTYKIDREYLNTFEPVEEVASEKKD